MTTTVPARVDRGVPTGGQFATTSHGEPSVALKVPSSTELHRLVFEDQLSNGERRSMTRQALEQSLSGDDFNVVYSVDQQAAIRAEAERDDSVDEVLDTLEANGVRPHHFGADTAALLHRSHARRDAVEKHYVPTAADTFHAAARHISGTPEEYLAALKAQMPHVDKRWYENMLQNQQVQPEGWHRKQLFTLAVMNERFATLKANRDLVSADENPNFVSQPVSALESDIDQAILDGRDVLRDDVIDEFHRGAGKNYGTFDLKTIAEWRVHARRVPAETTEG